MSFLKKFNIFYLWRRIDSLEDDLLYLQAQVKEASQLHSETLQENEELSAEVKRLERLLKAEKQKNRKWFEIVLSYAPDDLIFVNQKLWGHKIELVRDDFKLKENDLV